MTYDIPQGSTQGALFENKIDGITTLITILSSDVEYHIKYI